MTGAGAPVLFFCLLTGAALGALYALLKALRLCLSAGRLLTALLDTLFGILCGGVVFLTALAVDKGRLRLVQALLQIVGGWSAAVALDPVAVALGRAVSWVKRKILRRGPKKT